MSTKEILFTLFFLAGSAGLVAGVLAMPKLRRVYLCLLFLGVLKIVDVNYLSREEYRGWVRGFELGSLDMLVIGLLAAVVAGGARNRSRLILPVLGPFLVYLATGVLSAVAAYVPLYALFGLAKLGRDLAVFWVVANATQDEEDLRWLIWTVAAAVSFEGLISVNAYFDGVYRARGTFSHSNTLGMYLNMVLPLVLSFLLNVTTRWQWLLLGVFGLGAGTVVLTLSRGSWATMVVTLALVVPLSLARNLKPEKLVLLGVMALLALPPGVVAVHKMIRRVAEAPEASGEARHTFNQTAREMAGDHLFGIGVNNYSYGTDTTPYAEPYNGGLDQGGLCHNIYYLNLGEMGWVGLAAFLLLLASMYRVIVAFLLRHRGDDLRWAWMVGWLAGMTTVVLQSWLEWALRQTALSFTFYGLSGVMVAVARMAPSRRAVRWRVGIRYARPWLDRPEPVQRVLVGRER